MASSGKHMNVGLRGDANRLPFSENDHVCLRLSSEMCLWKSKKKK